LNYKRFVEEIARRTGLSEESAREASDEIAKLLTGWLKEGDMLSLQGFGTFEVNKRKERISVHPVTGKRWLIPPKLIPVFKPGPTLRGKIRRLDQENHHE